MGDLVGDCGMPYRQHIGIENFLQTVRTEGAAATAMNMLAEARIRSSRAVMKIPDLINKRLF